MAEKKFGLGAVLLISVGAAAVAGGVVSYIKRAEIKKLAEDIIARVKPADGADDADEKPGDWDIRSGEVQEAAVPEDVNIVDSGVSLESVEAEAEPEAVEETAEEAEAGEPEAADAGEPVEAEAGEPEAADGDEEDDIEPPKKPWFWSK